jgi:hypothetical protein
LFRFTDPEVLRLPDQFPEAVQVSTLLLLHCSCVDPPYDTLCGLAVIFTIGADGATTVTLTESLTLPPAPLQVRI